MNARRALAKEGHDEGIDRVRAGHLYIESQLVRGDALEQKLARISVFPLIPFQGHGEQPKTNPHRQ